MITTYAFECLAEKVPYLWGGKDRAIGLDCSGLVTSAYLAAGGPDWRHTHRADDIWARALKVSMPDAAPGDIACYPGHVMVYVGGGMCVGQAYGGHLNTTTTYSRIRGHWTKHLKVSYRPDFRGYVRLP